MKHPIEWHENRLTNRMSYLDRQRDKLNRLQVEIDRLIDDNNHLSMQISIARQRGKDGFDEDRFLKMKSR